MIFAKNAIGGKSEKKKEKKKKVGFFLFQKAFLFSFLNFFLDSSF